MTQAVCKPLDNQQATHAPQARRQPNATLDNATLGAKGMRQKVIKSVQDILGAADEALRHHPKGVWWRGHSSTTFRLAPGVFRQREGDLAESELLVLFQSLAPSRHRNCPTPLDFDRWLLLAQHYRLPTRLLDWTESPLVAAFFAVSSREGEDGDLIALEPWKLNKESIGAPVILVSSAPDAAELIKGAFTGDIKMGDNRIASLLGHEIDLRILLQQGRFTVHTNKTPIEEMQYGKKVVLRFKIPAKYKSTIRRQLSSLGIKSMTLFPDLDHLSGDLRAMKY